LGVRDDGGGEYRQARQWELNRASGRLEPTRDIDFSDHGRPEYHPNPHQHLLMPNNPQKYPAGGFGRDDARQLDYGWTKYPY
jgi:hypothetical protein